MMTVDTWALAVRGQSPLYKKKTGRIWPVIVSGLCTVEVRFADIF